MKSKTLLIGLVIIAISTQIAGIAVSVGTGAEQSEAGRFIVTAETQSGIYGVPVTTVTPSSDDLLGKYEKNDKQLKKYEFKDAIVYFHQRMIDDAIVEGDYINYQFDRNTKELLDKRTHWRSDLPEHVTPVITKEEAESMVRGEVQFTKLYIISPDSVVFPFDPTPEKPCWVVRSVDNDNMIVTIIDAVEGKTLGYGVPPPQTITGFSLSGPWYFNPCSGWWTTWYQNAESWFNTMGYPTEAVVWPTEAKVRSHIQSIETAMFYELAHGGNTSFASGCLDGNDSEYTSATEIHDWIAGYTKMPFTFIGSCGGMCDVGTGTFSYEFRKGLTVDTTTVGYCGMGSEACSNCWDVSVAWQDTLFNQMDQGWTVKQAFDKACADYPVCVGCIRFAGDVNFAVVPVVERGTLTDVYEPDDNYSLANHISVAGTKQTHNFHVPGDQDWLKFNATKGESYTIETSELGEESDTYLYLYDTDGITEIDNDDDNGIGLASKIVWNCSISGTYYLMVRHYSSSAFGPETRYTISVTEKEAIFDTGSPLNPYPSIMGNHTGTIKSNHTVIATKLYTYPCVGTGGHTEYAEIRNATWNATATWEGYVGDWHNITFDKTVVLLENKTYTYTIRTGSYPQIIHESPFNATGGTITCDKFTDANGRIYYDWIPAIGLW